MAHLNSVRLPESIAKGVVYGPEFVTTVAGPAAREKRNRERERALCVGEFGFSPTLEADYPALLTFFRSVGGRLHTWRFPDLSDCTASYTDGVVEAIDSTHFQLCKRYRVTTGFEEVRLIQAPIAARFTGLKNSGTLLTPGTDYTLDDATGIVTTTAPRTAGNLTWAGAFDNVVRFDTDRMATANVGYRVQQWGQIPIVERRL